MRFLLFLLWAGCGEVIGVAINTQADPGCVAAMSHVKECDDRFMDAASAMCVYVNGKNAPVITSDQERCIRGKSCEEVRRATAA